MISESDVEKRFGTNAGQAEFPTFCNALIAQEAPRTSTFPVLSSKPGPDGGMDGEWDLSGVDDFEPLAIARAGWNIYQFKTVDVATLGADTAFKKLCARVRGAIAELIARLANPKTPALYVLFTNLQLGLETVSTTASGAELNKRRSHLHRCLLKGAPASVEIAIIDAGQIASIVNCSPALRAAWFSKYGATWEEAQKAEQTLSQAIFPLLARDKELADLQRWLLDPAIRVVALSGPSGIGKTRLVIEATRDMAPLTVFLNSAASALQDGIAVYARPGKSVVIVLDDPPVESVERLEAQAMACPHPVKLLITIPSPASAPVVRLVDERTDSLHLTALNKEAAQQIIQVANPGIDGRIRDWIIGQAGGVPGILVDAARLGNELRQQAGTLREQLTRKYRQRLSSHVDQPSLLAVLEVLSPLVYVGLSDDSPELPVLLQNLGGTLSPLDVRRRLAELEPLGLLRRQGNFVAVTPPLFAAGLFERLLEADAHLPIRLFQQLDFSARLRLLERLVMLGLPETSPFWRFVFGSDGPFGEPARFSANFELLDYLARASPGAVLRFVQLELDFLWTEVLPEAAQGANQLANALHALLEESTTAEAAFLIVVDLAKREAFHEHQTTFLQLFTECFVYWYPLQISYSLKRQIVESLLSDAEAAHRRLGMKAITTTTNPPHMLGGRAVRAQRLSSHSDYGTQLEAHGFLIDMMRRRLALCAGDDAELRQLALTGLPETITELGRWLYGEASMRMVREITQVYFEGGLPVEATDLYVCLRDLRNFFDRSSKTPEQLRWLEEWRGVIAELDALMVRLIDGRFERRLKLALGHSINNETVIVDGRELYGFEAELYQLAKQACASPTCMDAAAWAVLQSGGASHVDTFVRQLGEVDVAHHYLPTLLAHETSTGSYGWLGWYLQGSARHSADWIEETLATLAATPTVPKLTVLQALVIMQPTPRNRERLKTLLAEKVVAPGIVAHIFSYGRWLNDLPPSEVLAVLEFILSEPGHECAALNVLSHYLHFDKALPRELFPVALQILPAAFQSASSGDYDHNQVATGVARTDLERGFDLLADTATRIEADWRRTRWNHWNPFDGYGSRGFWEYLRSAAPERAYRLLARQEYLLRFVNLGGNADRGLLDFTGHHALLLGLARENEESACVFAGCLQPGKPEFFPFAYELLALHPDSQKLPGRLSGLLTGFNTFGTMYEKLTDVAATVRTQLAQPATPAPARRWLHSLLQHVEHRQQEELSRHEKTTEPHFLD